jgi:hypothetical protein
MFRYCKLLWNGCVEVAGKLAEWAHSLSTSPTDIPLNVFRGVTLHTYLEAIYSTSFHTFTAYFNRLDGVDFHTIHLAYNYNYLYINKRSKGLTE